MIAWDDPLNFSIVLQMMNSFLSLMILLSLPSSSSLIVITATFTLCCFTITISFRRFIIVAILLTILSSVVVNLGVVIVDDSYRLQQLLFTLMISDAAVVLRPLLQLLPCVITIIKLLYCSIINTIENFRFFLRW